MTGQEGREASGEVFDLGYQHYPGPREGRSRARRALYVNGLRTTLGIGRGPLAKVLAVLMFGAAVVPAVIMAVVVALFEPVGEALPSHVKLVSLVLLLFAAIVGPELLCPDRRYGVIHLYLVRPITARDYAGARWLALLTVTVALVILGSAGPVAWSGALRVRSCWLSPRELAGHPAHPGSGTGGGSVSWPQRRWRWPRSPTAGPTPPPS